MNSLLSKEPESKFQIPSARNGKKMNRINDLCDRLLRFAVDVILYLRTVLLFFGLEAWNLRHGFLRWTNNSIFR